MIIRNGIQPPAPVCDLPVESCGLKGHLAWQARKSYSDPALHEFGVSTPVKRIEVPFIRLIAAPHRLRPSGATHFATSPSKVDRGGADEAPGSLGGRRRRCRDCSAGGALRAGSCGKHPTPQPP